jgi:hypothetical protein
VLTVASLLGLVAALLIPRATEQST